MREFALGSVIRTRNRLWRVDGQPEDDVIVASTIDGGEARQLKLYVPFEDIQPGQLQPPSAEIVGHIQAHHLHHGTAEAKTCHTNFPGTSAICRYSRLCQ